MQTQFHNCETIQTKSIIRLYDGTYNDTVENFLLVYNPFSQKGITVLNKPAAYLFKLINNKRSLNDIYLLAKKKDKRVKLTKIKNILLDFLNSEIIYFDSFKTNKLISFDNKKQLIVWFHITNQCNLRCKYCYIWKTSGKMADEVAKEAIHKILIDAKRHKFHSVKIMFSGGECLLEFKRILNLIQIGKDYATEIGIDIHFSILTNGVLITSTIAKTLKENNIGVGVSLDGLGKYHDTQRVFVDGSGTFKYVINGINNLLKEKVSFSVTVVVTTQNIEGLPHLTKYLLDRRIRFKYSLFRDNHLAEKRLRTDDNRLIKYLKESCQIIYDYAPVYQDINHSFLDNILVQKPHLYPCSMGRNYMVVTHEGKIASCPITTERTVGSLASKDIIRSMKEGNFIRPSGLTVENIVACRNCQWRYACRGGCPYLTYECKNTYQSNSPYCSVYKALIPELLRIEAKMILVRNGLKKIKV